jgi:hypothetical protein
MKILTILLSVIAAIALALPAVALQGQEAAAQTAGCPTCGGTTVVVDEDVTIDFNTVLKFGDAPTYTGDPDLLPYFSWDTPSGTFNTGLQNKINQAWLWKAVFDLKDNRLVLTNNAKITIVRYYYGKRPTSDDPSPGIEIFGTCGMDMEAGTSIIIQAHNDLAGNTFIHFDGNVNIEGTIKNWVDGTGGKPGKITISSCCGDVTVSDTGLVQTIGQDPGGNDIDIVAVCPPCNDAVGGDIFIRGLVDAAYKGGVAPTINIVSYGGEVTIDGRNFLGIEAGTQRRITSGVTMRSTHDPVPGNINIQALGDITVLGNRILQWQYPNIGAVGIKTASNSSKGGAIKVVSLEGKIIASDRAFDNANRFNTNATITLLAKGNIELTATGASNSVHYPASENAKAMAVVSTQGGDCGQGGTNTLRSYSGGISIGPNTQVLANWTGRPGSSGTNLLTSCTGVNVGVDGQVNPADANTSDDSGVCGSAPDAIYTDPGADFGVECECVRCGPPPCPTCDGEEVIVDQNVTIDFNQADPNNYYSGDPDLKPYFSYDTNGATPNLWKAIFNMGAKKLIIKDNVIITVVNYYFGVGHSTSDDPSPGLEFLGTCELEVEGDTDGNGTPGTILVQSHNDLAGDIVIHFDGNININGTVKNEVTGTGGKPGKITISSCCGDINVGPKGRVLTSGVDPGGSDINLLNCGEGNIFINGLVEAVYKGGSVPTINVVSFAGKVTIDGNIDDPANPGQKITNLLGIEAGTQRRITSGVIVRSTNDPVPGNINIQALGDITVLGNTLLDWSHINYGVVAIKTGSNSSVGGVMKVVSLGGKIIASDRAFDNANRFNDTATYKATIDLLAAGDIVLTATGRSNSVHYPASENAKAMAVVSTQAGSAGKGGTNTLRSYSGGIYVGNGSTDGRIAQVLANGTTAGTNLLTSCTGVNVGVDGQVNPADLLPGDDSGVCSPDAPTTLFTGCLTDFGIVWVCAP